MTTTKIEFPVHAWPKLRAGLEFLLAEPRRFDMRYYNLDYTALDPAEKGTHTKRMGGPPPCGTVLCFAGAITVADAIANPDEAEKINGKFSDILVSEFIAVATLGLDIESTWGYDENLGSKREIFADPAADALNGIFQDTTGIRNLSDLWARLDATFTFPEPLPALPAGL